MSKKYSIWTDEEKEKVKQMYRQGYVYREISEALERPISSVGKKVEACLQTGELTRRCKPHKARPEVSKYTFVRNSSLHYKEVLPPEKWPIVENFLAAFCRYALVAEKAGRKLDVRVFIDEYAKIYRRREEICML